MADIHAFVRERNLVAADRLVSRLIARGDSLAKFPNRGRRVPEIPDSPFRELIEGNYRIVYRVRSGNVEIATIFEGHSLLPFDDLAE
jgi:toxin ParE1/3/4